MQLGWETVAESVKKRDNSVDIKPCFICIQSSEANQSRTPNWGLHGAWSQSRAHGLALPKYVCTLNQPARAVREARNSISSWNVWTNICASWEIRRQVEVTFNASSRTLSEPELGADITQGRAAGWLAGSWAGVGSWRSLSHGAQWAMHRASDPLPLKCGWSTDISHSFVENGPRPRSFQRPFAACSPAPSSEWLCFLSNYFCLSQTLQRQWLHPISD